PSGWSNAARARTGAADIIRLPTPELDRLVDWVGWSYGLHGITIYGVSHLMGWLAIAALLVAEIIFFVRDFYGPQAYLLFSLPVKGRHVIGSRLGLFTLDFLLLFLLDLPIRFSFYRGLVATVTTGEVSNYFPWLTPADWGIIGILAGIVGILIFTIIPLLAYLLIAIAKCVFDLSVGWLTPFVALGVGAFTGLCYLIASVLPPWQLPPPQGVTIWNAANPFLPVLLLTVSVLLFWAGTKVIDRKLNI
ncbi:MAG: hypothetical protein P8Y68_19720, partial [Anaerolineales bacterium]